MTKQDFVRVGIRIFGIYPLVQAVVSLAGVVNSIFMASQFRDMPGQSGLDSVADQLYRHDLSEITGGGPRLLLFTLFGLSLLRGGLFVFELASRPLAKPGA